MARNKHLFPPTRRGVWLDERRRRPPLRQVSDSGMTVVVSTGMQRRLKDLEYLSDLQGDKAYYAYDRMRRSDPHIYGIASAFDLPLIDATWRVDPAPDSGEHGKTVADAVRKALFERMLDAWPTQVRQFLLFPYYGYAPFEMCWRVDEGQVWFDRFAWLPPTTIKDIYVERGRVTKVEQYNVNTMPGARFKPTLMVPGEKLVWFVNGKEGDNYRGVSLLRSMHRDWFAKEKAIIMFLILAERMGGVLHIETPKNATEKDKTAADKLGENFRVGDSLYIRSPEGWNIDLKGVPLQLGDLREFIRDCDAAISDAALAQHLDLGKSEHGSYALAGSLQETFLNAVQSRAKYLASVMNADGGPIHQFVEYNFGSREGVEGRPQLVAGRVSRMNIAAVSDALLKLYQCGYPLGPEMWKFISEEAEFPPPDEQLARAKAKQALEMAQLGPQDLAPPTNNVPDSKATRVEKKAEAAKKLDEGDEHPFEVTTAIRLADGSQVEPFWRDPRGPEVYVAVDDIRQLFDGAREELARRTQVAREALVTKLVGRAVGLLEKDGGIDAVMTWGKQSAPGEDRLAKDIATVFEGWFDAGRTQVRDELERQRKGQPVLTSLLRSRGVGLVETEVKLAAPRVLPRSGRDYARSVSQDVLPAKVVEDLVAEPVVPAIGGAATQSETITALAKLAATNVAQAGKAVLVKNLVSHLSGSAVGTPGVDNLQTYLASNAVVATHTATLNAGMSVTKLVNLGREAAAQDASEAVKYGVYSALMDHNTCEVCAHEDGRVYQSIDDAEGRVPNPECLGETFGNACRCVIVYLYEYVAPVGTRWRPGEPEGDYPDTTLPIEELERLGPAGPQRQQPSLTPDVPTFSTLEEAEQWAKQHLGLDECHFTCAAYDPQIHMSALSSVPLPLAQRTVEELRLMRARGVALPRKVTCHYDAMHREGIGMYSPAGDAISYNTANRTVLDWHYGAEYPRLLQEAQAEFGWFTSKELLHPIHHELGHMVATKANPLLDAQLHATYALRGQPMVWRAEEYTGSAARRALTQVTESHPSPPGFGGELLGLPQPELRSMRLSFNTPDHIEVSEYGLCHPQEFIAETFAGLLVGVEYQPCTMFWYTRLGGVVP